MKLEHGHPWNVTPAQARAIQERLRGRVEMAENRLAIERVGGVDVGIERARNVTRAAVVVLELEGLTLVDQAVAEVPTSFPYVPGLLSFREIPAILRALADLRILPEVLLCDGQGYAHPRRFGLACHLGVLTGLPSIGVAKSRLIGEHGKVPDRRGAWTPLLDSGEVVGAVLRTRTRVKPLYVSVGHRLNLAAAIELVLQCTPRYRLPETTRLADRLASGSAPVCAREGSSTDLPERKIR